MDEVVTGQPITERNNHTFNYGIAGAILGASVGFLLGIAMANDTTRRTLLEKTKYIRRHALAALVDLWEGTRSEREEAKHRLLSTSSDTR